MSTLFHPLNHTIHNLQVDGGFSPLGYKHKSPHMSHLNLHVLKNDPKDNCYKQTLFNTFENSKMRQKAGNL